MSSYYLSCFYIYIINKNEAPHCKSGHLILYKARLHITRLVVDAFNYSVDSIGESLQHNGHESSSNFAETKFYKG